MGLSVVKKAFALVVALCLAPIGAQAWWQSVAQQSVGAAPTYQGPGDVVGSATFWGSCARVYSAAGASTSTSLCDLVAVTGGGAVCTLRGSSTGFVDLAGSYCAGTTPAAACAAASGGSCKVTKVYNQVSPGTLDAVQATLANMPALAFAAINSFPALRCTNAAGTSLATGNITQAQPLTMSAVFNRTGSVTTQSAAVAAQAGPLVGGNATANTSVANAGSNLTRTANDNAFHAIQGVMNGAVAGANNTDGSDAIGNTGSNAMSATPLRFCRSGGGVSSDMDVMEGGLWPIGFDATQRGIMNTNQHGVNGYNF
jgi:hypothetical protein